jgi:hypothetical protein
LYVNGSPGGFADGVNHNALRSLKTMVPAGPGALDLLLGACACFHPVPFHSYPTFATVAEQLGDTTRLDFVPWTDIPTAWPELREEAGRPFASCISGVPTSPPSTSEAEQ